MMAIASLGIKNIVFGVSYKSFNLLLPFEPELIDYETIMKKMGVSINLVGPVLEDEGMKTFEYWGGNYREPARVVVIAESPIENIDIEIKVTALVNNDTE